MGSDEGGLGGRVADGGGGGAADGGGDGVAAGDDQDAFGAAGCQGGGEGGSDGGFAAGVSVSGRRQPRCVCAAGEPIVSVSRIRWRCRAGAVALLAQRQPQ